MVGLVENGDLDRGQVRVSGTHVILQPTRAGDDDVDTGAQFVDLRVGADAAEDGDAAQVRRRDQRGQRRVDLGDRGRRGARLVRLVASRATMGSRKA